MDLAPVADVDTNPRNPVIADRSFGRTPSEVSAMAAAFARGLQQEGVAACAKHFPGHGDTAVDSHLSLPLLPHSLARLEQVELPPFQALAAQGIAAVMVAHLWAPALDETRPEAESESSSEGATRAAHARRHIRTYTWAQIGVGGASAAESRDEPGARPVGAEGEVPGDKNQQRKGGLDLVPRVPSLPV